MERYRKDDVINAIKEAFKDNKTLRVKEIHSILYKKGIAVTLNQINTYSKFLVSSGFLDVDKKGIQEKTVFYFGHRNYFSKKEVKEDAKI